MEFSTFRSFITFFLITSMESTHLPEIHTCMGPEELQEIFGAVDDVPGYELIQIQYSNPNATIEKSISFNAFNKSVSLTLREMDRQLISKKTPIWFADGIKNTMNVRYSPINSDALNDALKFYEDPENMAGIGIEEDVHGNIRFTGNIRNRLVIKPVPERLHEVWRKLFQKSPSRVKRSSENHSLADYHIVINYKVSENEFFRTKRSPTELREVNYVPPYHGPDPIFLRVLVYVDFGINFTSDQEVRLYKLLVYLVCFWNAVNMRYSTFENPKIKLHIAGIVIGVNRWAAPYLQIPLNSKRSGSHASTALTNFSTFLAYKDPAPGLWDIVVSQSNIRLCPDDECTRKVLGMTYVHQTCNNFPMYYLRTVALVVDNYNFDGILSATHEIGHLFGAEHDGYDRFCVDQGYVMSKVSDRSSYFNNSYWSPCSRNEILTRLRTNTSYCWKYPEIINENDSVPELLPGHIISLQDQCIIRGFNYAKDDEKTSCISLACCSIRIKLVSIKSCSETGPPFPGSHCGNGMHCKYEKCVPRIE